MSNKLTQLETQLHHRLEQSREATIKLVQDVVGFKSINPRFMSDGTPSEEAPLQDYLEALLRELGLDVTRWEEEAGRPNLVARRAGSGGGKSLIFNGHIDVVPVGTESLWKHDPWGSEIIDGRLYGRGTIDMKGGVVGFVAATRALVETGVELKGDLQLHIVVDEEAGGFAGTRAVIAKGYRADGVIVAEPSHLTVQAAEGGLSWVRVTIQGRSGHAGWRFAHIYPQQADMINTGAVNAIEKGVRFVQAVRELEREWALRRHHPLLPPGITTINPGVIVGGVGLGENGLPRTLSNPAMIPDVCVIDFDFKYLPTETLDEVRREFEAFVEAFAKTDRWLMDHTPKVEWHLGNIDFPPFSTPPDHPLIEAVRGAQQSLHRETVLAGKQAVTDAAFYAGAGMTPIILGPAGANWHGEDEYVDLDSIVELSKVFAGVMLRWCVVV